MPSSVRHTHSPAPSDAARHLRVSEVAAALGVTDATVRRWVKDGLLPARRLGPGRLILIDPSDLEALISSSGFAIGGAS